MRYYSYIPFCLCTLPSSVSFIFLLPNTDNEVTVLLLAIPSEPSRKHGRQAAWSEALGGPFLNLPPREGLATGGDLPGGTSPQRRALPVVVASSVLSNTVRILVCSVLNLLNFVCNSYLVCCFVGRCSWSTHSGACRRPCAALRGGRRRVLPDLLRRRLPLRAACGGGTHQRALYVVDGSSSLQLQASPVIA